MSSIAKLAKRTRSIISDSQTSVRQAFRGVLNRVNASEPMQTAQVAGLADETLQDVEHVQQFGFTSNPPPGTEAIIIPLGGTTTHGIVIATENGDYRIKSLAPGEVAIYNQSGASITLKNGKVINIDCNELNINASAGVNITAPDVNCSQQLTANGQINGNGGMAVRGGSGATFSGNIAQTDGSYSTTGDVTAGSISLTNHDHTMGVGKPV
ncbi:MULTISPECIES: phage baseplate assembly protein V [Snodgrassella]|uniref:phage baseplate assembly protein V n=1 Tax=Snodgrassella TaxID=1193515 RepID=UPI000815CA6C|nr:MULTISPECIES: phage baseplate assembly protein V [Snodgrassella]MCO6514489.1 phage baseplate assembly protein V [Snodgrassella sp.]MCO6520914.1 phage baseplate assembly protein V [Snodgrassella sp.]SCC12417.1 phage baseplate assembly protein V [Snodgrassella sp. R-53583]